MKFLEKDLEEIIFNSERNKLADKGLYISGKLMRQLKIGNYGIADLVTIERPMKDEIESFKGVITVYELKQNKIGISAFLQALGYVKGIERYLSKRGFPTHAYDFRIVLIGSEIDEQSTFTYLIDYMTHCPSTESYYSRLSLNNYIYDYDIDGIQFTEQSSYSLINEGF